MLGAGNEYPAAGQFYMDRHSESVTPGEAPVSCTGWRKVIFLHQTRVQGNVSGGPPLEWSAGGHSAVLPSGLVFARIKMKPTALGSTRNIVNGEVSQQAPI